MASPTYSSLSNNELLQYLKRGDEGAFTEVYNRYWRKLLAIGYCYSHNKEEAEDILHEVMMSLWIRKNELVVESLESYLATAVKFAVFKSIARNKRRRALLDSKETEPVTFDLEEKLEVRFQEALLRDEIDKLPTTARLVFVYSREENLTIKEIAGRLDLSPKAVEYHMTKAQRVLREALKKIKSFLV